MTYGLQRRKKMMKKTLKITLRSDLCVGTGKGFAAIIDEDTAIDEYGIPFIPGKRIKGCLRELAEETFEISEKKLNDIFGTRGNDEAGSLIISDAKINDYDSQLDEIKSAISAGQIKANDITELFCSVRANTAIENDTAKKNSLRFTRVVNRTSPIDNKPLVFYADIEYDEVYNEDISKLFKALRNIGYRRNRGWGCIKCELLDFESSFILEKKDFDNNKNYRISYTVYLQGDLMLPAADANQSLDYIPGTSVLGAFAGIYIKKYGEAEFNEYFFSSDIKFGNLYISDKEGTEYMPAPAFLAKIKAAQENEKGIYNMILNADEDDKKDIKPQYKPLKKGYINMEKGYKEPDAEIVYHNAINTKESKENKGGLYTQYCISSGQYFKGYVDVNGDKAEKIFSLFDSGKINFGRSRNSQYSHCLIKDINIEEIKEYEVELKNKTLAAYLCESDIVLLENGRYTVSLEDLCKNLDVSVDRINKFTRISTRIISGYNAKWNMKKPQFPVIKAGSCVVFEADKDDKKPEFIYIGTKQNEGYGRIRLISDAKAFLIKENADSNNKAVDCSSVLLKEIKKCRADENTLEKAIEAGLKINLNPSQVGRIILMCKESDSFEDFARRIESIKTDDTRNEAKRCFGEDTIKKIIGESCDWNAGKRYIIDALTIKKYQLRRKNK